MSIALTTFPPSAAEAQARLGAFVPRAGIDYPRKRNFDRGAGHHHDVSALSPYLRLKLLDEITVARAVLSRHDAGSADKFLTEVFWRTYWKGWMELRPAVWNQYRQQLDRLHNDVQTQSGLRQRWEAACTGTTGLAPFDSWAHELASTGYLHNHARMWFASIWIFTLKLPWELGADFFLRHLLDGDAAVNTLSWRWVAGIQTRGKTYLATTDNIAAFTDGRFPRTEGLAPVAQAVNADENPPAHALPPCAPGPLPRRYGLLLHDDDADLARLLQIAPDPVAIAYLDGSAGHSPWHMAPHVAAFRTAAARSVTGADSLTLLTDRQGVAAWASAQALEQIVTPYAPVGPTRRILNSCVRLEGLVPLSRYRRPLDTAAWPLATKGFFPFRKNIPDLLGQFLPI
jgi:deoxyribodipyrimidine photo-lyase